MINRTILFAYFLLTIWAASAQKLPVVQQSGLRAPTKVKIDGKITEWGQLQAYNKSTDIFYSIANDDKTLYLVVEAKDPNIITKIIRGGITFSVNTSGKKTGRGALSITYPIIEEKYGINLSSRRLPEKIDDTVKYKRKVDSAIYAYNQKLNNDTKTIGIGGSKDITDSIISVYNEEGIKARSLFDDHLNFIYELAVPLKYLSLSNEALAPFAYHIALNGIVAKNATIQLSGKGMYMIIKSADGSLSAIPNKPQYTTLTYLTDLWGEYTLVK